ncbi:YbaB/EbfC family nucleoid-associated protein [Helicobacter sp. MIT 14-3879]|uniref:YbaB/EbfC family nucleoid-associated protein n=1 Tax=Helicobacter sp. MIT 14-3879 TaxID=2040649 RepID=UPI000E1F636F|nr:YbaB/EbfC family nucleoid-associated protein [Helicobacter sp. MIT 14-3879]RDU64795.1 nucleoid-associated protein, YbaB/EbfC family [Helicobacter sp. MIT 14-3879]
MINDFANMLNQLQDNIKNIEEKQANTIYSAKSGGGLVSVSVNGKGEVIDLNIDKSLLDDVEAMQILIIGAINEALKNAESAKKNSAMELFGDLSSFK